MIRYRVAGVVARGVGDGTAANTGASWLEGDKQGLHNPLAWDNMPSILQEKFPHLKNMSPLVGPTHQGICLLSVDCISTTGFCFILNRS